MEKYLGILLVAGVVLIGLVIDYAFRSGIHKFIDSFHYNRKLHKDAERPQGRFRLADRYSNLPILMPTTTDAEKTKRQNAEIPPSIAHEEKPINNPSISEDEWELEEEPLLTDEWELENESLSSDEWKLDEQTATVPCLTSQSDSLAISQPRPCRTTPSDSGVTHKTKTPKNRAQIVQQRKKHRYRKRRRVLLLFFLALLTMILVFTACMLFVPSFNQFIRDNFWIQSANGDIDWDSIPLKNQTEEFIPENKNGNNGVRDDGTGEIINSNENNDSHLENAKQEVLQNDKGALSTDTFEQAPTQLNIPEPELEVVPGEIVDMDEEQQYAANIFLSNFSEQGAFERNGFDVNNPNYDELLRFVYLYCKINRRNVLGVSQELNSYFYTITMDTVNNVLNRHFGITITDEQASLIQGGCTYMNGAFYYPAADGESYNKLTVVNKMESFEDDTYCLYFDIYSLNRDVYGNNNGAVDNSYYYSTESSAATDPNLTKLSSGQAIVRPYEHDGIRTFQLIRYTVN